MGLVEKPSRPISDLSVVVTLHNASRYIEATINSLLRQVLPPREIIVVDDASTDGSAQIVERLASEAQVDLRLLRNGDAVGVARARNQGAWAATSEWVGFCDHDDLWHVERTRLLLELATTSPKLLAVASSVAGFASESDRKAIISSPRRDLVVAWLQDASDELSQLQDLLPIHAEISTTEVTADVLRGDPNFVTTQAIYRRAAFFEAGGCAAWSFLADDWMLNVAIAERRSFVVLSDVLVFYRVLPTSQSHQMRKSSISILAAAVALRYGGESVVDRPAGRLYDHLLLEEARGRAQMSQVLGFALLANYGPYRLFRLLASGFGKHRSRDRQHQLVLFNLVGRRKGK